MYLITVSGPPIVIQTAVDIMDARSVAIAPVHAGIVEGQAWMIGISVKITTNEIELISRRQLLPDMQGDRSAVDHFQRFVNGNSASCRSFDEACLRRHDAREFLQCGAEDVRSAT